MRCCRGLLAGLFTGLLLTILCVAIARAQEPDEKKPEKAAPRPIRSEDYSKFESLGQFELSPNGLWLAYETSRRDAGTRELRLRMLATDSVETFKEGRSAVFSEDSRWLAFSIGVSEDEREKLQKAKKPVPSKVGLHSLVDGRTREFEGFGSFSFSADGRYLLRRRSGEGDGGIDVVVHDLQTDRETTFGSVGEAAWSDVGALLAICIQTSDDSGNGVCVFDPERSTLRTLDSAKRKYRQLSWREKSFDLAVLRASEHEKDEDPTHDLLAWRQLREPSPRRYLLEPQEHDDFPAGYRIAEYTRPRWSETEELLTFGIQEWDDAPEPEDKDSSDEKPAKKGEENESDEKAPKKPEKDEKGKEKSLRDSLSKEPAGVEVWHPKDIDIIPRQKRTASQDERETETCAFWLDGRRFVRLSTPLTEDVRLLEGARYALGLDNTPYEEQRRFGPTLFDVYWIDVLNGERKQLLSRIKYLLSTGPGAGQFLYVSQNHVWSHDVLRGAPHNLTRGIESSFINRELSTLTDEKPPYGVAGWSRDGKWVYLYDRYDIWKIAFDGSSRERLTKGAEDQIVYRRLVLDPEADEWIVPGRPMYLSVYGDRTKRSGFARLDENGVETLTLRDAELRRLTKSEDADRFAFVAEDFDDSPDIYVAGPMLEDPLRVTDTNPWQSDYLWGHSELVEYESAGGETLQGALYYPADYDPKKQYPMIVYIYELRSQALHSYSVPSELHPYNPAVFTAEGYFFFQPDIVYRRPQNPGLSALDCVVPAVKEVLESGKVDPAKVGLLGHSWGGYQTAFLVTQTDIFAAGVAGAPLTNMISMSMSIYWNSGQTDTWIFHESQGRMDQPFWRNLEPYIKNSAIFNIDALKTPLLVTFGDEDGAVDWQQGIELYNAARLAQKPVVLLVYPGENHGLAEKPNQIDYHYRVREWFDHYLRGAEAPKWITEGVPHLDRQEELEKAKKKD